MADALQRARPRDAGRRSRRRRRRRSRTPACSRPTRRALPRAGGGAVDACSRSERLRGVTETVGALNHEINNPLAAIAGQRAAPAARRPSSSRTRRRRSRRILEATRRIQRGHRQDGDADPGHHRSPTPASRRSSTSARSRAHATTAVPVSADVDEALDTEALTPPARRPRCRRPRTLAGCRAPLGARCPPSAPAIRERVTRHRRRGADQDVPRRQRARARPRVAPDPPGETFGIIGPERRRQDDAARLPARLPAARRRPRSRSTATRPTISRCAPSPATCPSGWCSTAG